MKLTSEQAILKLAKKARTLQRAYGETPEFWTDYAEELGDYTIRLLRRCGGVPKELRPNDNYPKFNDR